MTNRHPRAIGVCRWHGDVHLSGDFAGIVFSEERHASADEFRKGLSLEEVALEKGEIDDLLHHRLLRGVSLHDLLLTVAQLRHGTLLVGDPVAERFFLGILLLAVKLLAEILDLLVGGLDVGTHRSHLGNYSKFPMELE